MLHFKKLDYITEMKESLPPSKKSFYQALARIFRPIARMALKRGIAFGEVADVLKWAYVDVAQREFPIPGRKVSISRVCIQTGLIRRDVQRFQEFPIEEEKTIVKNMNRASRVTNGWRSDPLFLNNNGEPLELDIEGGDKSFTRLVKTYSGDMPIRALLDELKRTNSVLELENGMIRLIQKGYVPEGNEDELLTILSEDAEALLNTGDFNLERTFGESRFHKGAVYERMPLSSLKLFKQWLRKRANGWIEDANEFCLQYDEDLKANVSGEDTRRAGVVIYYFEDEAKEEI